MGGVCLLPQSKVCGVSLLAVYFNSCTRLVLVKVHTGQSAVILELLYVVVNAVAGLVCVARLEKTLNELYHFLYVHGRLRDKLGALDVESVDVSEEYACVVFGYFPGSLFLLTGGLVHLVLAVVAVAYQVAYVGYVHCVE